MDRQQASSVILKLHMCTVSSVNEGMHGRTVGVRLLRFCYCYINYIEACNTGCMQKIQKSSAINLEIQ